MSDLYGHMMSHVINLDADILHIHVIICGHLIDEWLQYFWPQRGQQYEDSQKITPFSNEKIELIE